MGSKKVDRASLLVLILIVVSMLSVCAAGGRELAQEMIRKDDFTTAPEEGAKASAHVRNLMVNTNDYGRYDQSPAFSKPRFKLIPN